MELTYQVPREAYIDLLAELIRKNDRRPFRIFTAFLMTVGQLLVVILLCVFRLEGNERSFFLIWSLLLAGVTVLRRCTVRQRAGGTLRRLEYSGQIPQDYWKEHRLQRSGAELRLRYGAQRLTCPLAGISRIDEKPHALYLRCGETIFDIVPESAFPSRETMARFAEELREAAAQAEIPAQDPARPQAADLAWNMRERAFQEGQYLAYRTLYYRYRFLRPMTFVRLAVSVFAAVSLLSNRTPANAVISVLLLLAANLENISMIPFVCRLRIQRELGEWNGSSRYRLSLRGNALIYAADHAEVRIPAEKINLFEAVGPYFVIAWNNFPAVILPLEVWQAPEASDLAEQIKALYKRT